MPSATVFTVQQAGADATSRGGKAKTVDQGGCLTAGASHAGHAAALDADTIDDAATILVSPPGLAMKTIAVGVLDMPVDANLIVRDGFE